MSQKITVAFVFSLAVLGVFVVYRRTSEKPQENLYISMDVNCVALMKEFAKFPDVLNAVRYSKQNKTCSLEIPQEKKGIIKPGSDFFQTIDALYRINNDFKEGEINAKDNNGEISWAFAAAELIRRTILRVPGANVISVRKIATLLLYLYQRPETSHKKNPQEVCPLFKIHCPIIREYSLGECPSYFPICWLDRLIGNDKWKKTRKVIDQVKVALDRGRILYGVFNAKNSKELGNYPEYAAIITNHFVGSSGNTEVYFHNFRDLKNKAVTGFMDVRSFYSIYEGFYEEELNSEKVWKSKYDDF